MEISGRDWKLFREKLPVWQEAYMERLNHEYVALLSGAGMPSEKFWTLHDRIRRDGQSKGVVLRLRKEQLPYDMAALIREGVIDSGELDGFSESLREMVLYLCGMDRMR